MIYLFKTAVKLAYSKDISDDEEGNYFDQKFVMNESNCFEFIKVPAYCDRVAGMISINKKRHYPYHKMPPVKLCNMTKTNGKEDKVKAELKPSKRQQPTLTR